MSEFIQRAIGQTVPIENHQQESEDCILPDAPSHAVNHHADGVFSRYNPRRNEYRLGTEYSGSLMHTFRATRAGCVSRMTKQDARTEYEDHLQLQPEWSD
jgi:hypothetical protein